MEHSPEKKRPKLVTALIETFGFSPWLASVVALFLVFLAAAALVWLWLSAPPSVITITSGPEGSSFQRNAEAYRDRLAEKRVTLKILPSGGSTDNLKRLQSGGADLGFVQSGLVGDKPPEGLVSLGSVSNQPLWIYYRNATAITRLSELAGKRIGVGAPGSGTHSLATLILGMNGITGAPTTFVEHDAEKAANELLKGSLDAVFLMGDSAPLATLRTMIAAPDLRLFNFAQADAYVRRHTFLKKIELPQGAFDVGKNLPAQDVTLIGPSVELLARKGFNSAVSDLLLSKAREVHGKGSILRKQGEFPAPTEGEYPISDDALRFYKSGLGITYKLIDNFWVASLINRVLVAIVPLLLVTIPAIRFLPIAYRWSVQLRIYRCYRPLLRLEADAHGELTRERAQELMTRLDEIEQDVNHLKVPASFAYQFYALQGHVAFVRSRLRSAAAA